MKTINQELGIKTITRYKKPKISRPYVITIRNVEPVAQRNVVLLGGSSGANGDYFDARGRKRRRRRKIDWSKLFKRKAIKGEIETFVLKKDFEHGKITRKGEIQVRTITAGTTVRGIIMKAFPSYVKRPGVKYRRAKVAVLKTTEGVKIPLSALERFEIKKMPTISPALMTRIEEKEVKAAQAVAEAKEAIKEAEEAKKNIDVSKSITLEDYKRKMAEARVKKQKAKKAVAESKEIKAEAEKKMIDKKLLAELNYELKVKQGKLKEYLKLLAKAESGEKSFVNAEGDNRGKTITVANLKKRIAKLKQDIVDLIKRIGNLKPKKKILGMPPAVTYIGVPVIIVVGTLIALKKLKVF